MADFVTERKAVAKADAKAKAKSAKQDMTVPRLAAKDFLAALEHALSWGCDDVSWQTYCTPPLAWNADLADGEDIGPQLVLLMDQHQVQWCGLHFLSRHLRANVIGIPGPFHRRHNDWGKALTMAGLMGAYLRMVVVANLGYGPWQGGGVPCPTG